MIKAWTPPATTAHTITTTIDAEHHAGAVADLLDRLSREPGPMVYYPYGKGRLRPCCVMQGELLDNRPALGTDGGQVSLAFEASSQEWTNRWTVPFWRQWYRVYWWVKRRLGNNDSDN